MDIVKLIEFKNWADEVYINYCLNLTDEQFNYQIGEYDNSIRKIVTHMYEVSWSWYQFIMASDRSMPVFSEMSRDDLVTGLRSCNQMILDLTDKYDLKKTYQLQWDLNDKVVVTNTENIIFNFVTHSAYHRGQLAIYLRILGIEEIKETDFNPYIYEIGQY